MVGEEIIVEIDATLDRLIRNAEAIQSVDVSDLSETEIDAFQKTQESLLQHFLHMDKFLQEKTKQHQIPAKKSAQVQIQEKLIRFEKLKSVYNQNLYDSMHRKSEILSKRRCKRRLSLR